MIYLLLFYEFFKIGLFAVGGGLVTIPFLFELTEKRDWFSSEDLANALGLVQSMPGAMGVNLAGFMGYETIGIAGIVVASVALVLPPLIIIMFLSKFLQKYNKHCVFQSILLGIAPSVVAIILLATLKVAEVTIVDLRSATISLVAFVIMNFYKKSPVFYIFIGALVGIIWKL